MNELNIAIALLSKIADRRSRLRVRLKSGDHSQDISHKYRVIASFLDSKLSTK